MNITLIIIAVGLVCVAVVTASYAYYCYNNMDSDLQNRAKSTTEFFKDYLGQDYDSFYESCITYTQTFEDGAGLELELQFIDKDGKIVSSSYGTWAVSSPQTPEF